MPQVKVLLVGNANHQYIKNFACWLRKKWNGPIIIDALTHVPYPERDHTYYDHIYYLDLYPTIFHRIPVFREILRILWSYRNQLKKIRHQDYDVLHIHFLFYYYFFGWRYLRESARNIVITVWGNDYNGIGNIRKKIVHWMLNKADLVSLTNSTMIKTISQYLKPGKGILKTSYGLSPLDALIKSKNISRSEAVRHFGLDEEKVIITCGYSNRNEHRQSLVIKAIENLPENLKKKVILVLPMTYGNELDNLNRVKNELNNITFEYRVFDSFVADKEVALLRKASDIFIHIVDYDQMSGAMIEYFYSNNIVVTGAWLPFQELEEQGFFIVKVEKPEHIGERLKEIISDLKRYQNKVSNNQEFIEQTWAWGKVIDKWIDIYKNLNSFNVCQ